MDGETIFKPGRNCYQIGQADQIDILIDAAVYYKSLYDSIATARESLFFLGWQFDSRVALLRGDEAKRARYPVQFLSLLQAVSAERPDLQIYILAWDHSILFASEREWLQAYHFQQAGPERIRFRFDRAHPAAGSHHQKIVTVDGRVGFCGGLDICGDRWDTPRHQRQNPLRRNPDGTSYDLFHDVQIAVQGAAVRVLEEIFYERWAACVGERLAPKQGPARESRQSLDLPHTIRLGAGPVAVSRTVPAGSCGLIAPIDEVARFYKDAIAAAERRIFIENQYFTSRVVFEALIERMRRRDRPLIEIVLILPQAPQNWKELLAIGAEQRRLLRRLRTAAQESGCALGVYAPVKSGENSLGPQPIYVHSKVLVIDDRVLSIGSANTTNRSLGLDTECNINIEAKDAARRRQIAKTAFTLLGEHLERPAEEVEARLSGPVSWVSYLEAACAEGNGGRLRILGGAPESWVDSLLPEGIYFDPESPPKPTDFFEEILDRPSQEAASRRPEWGNGALWKISLLGAFPIIGLLLFTFLRQRQIDVSSWIPLLEKARLSYWTPPLFLTGAVIASLISFPVIFFLLLGGILFGTFWGGLLNWAALLFGATASYLLSFYLGRPFVQRFGGKTTEAVIRWIEKRGGWAIVALRVIGIFPFTLVNFCAGISRIGFRNYLLGTALGTLPGVFIFSYFADALLKGTAHLPSKRVQLVLGVLILILWQGTSFWKKRWFR